MWPKSGGLHSRDIARSPFCDNRVTLSTGLAFLQIPHLHISQNTPCLPPTPPPPILHNLCFLFLLGITAIPREIEINAYAKVFGGKQGAIWEMQKWRINTLLAQPAQQSEHKQTFWTIRACAKAVGLGKGVNVFLI